MTNEEKIMFQQWIDMNGGKEVAENKKKTKNILKNY